MLKITVIYEFIQHYCTAFKDAWRERKQNITVHRKNDEIAFLPAHLELLEKPVSALPKWSARLIILFLLAAIIWAYFSKVDVVATAQGKIIASGRSKVIQPLETAAVKKIYVRNGEQVQKDQLLVELTSIGVDTDVSITEELLKASVLSQLRIKALLDSIEKQRKPNFHYSGNLEISSENLEREKLLAINQYNAWKAQKGKLQALIEQKKEERKTIKINIAKYNDIHRYEKERTQDLFKLYKQKSTSKHDYYQQKNKQLEIENLLETQRNRLQEIEKEINQATQEYQSFMVSFKSDLLNELKKLADNNAQMLLERDKAQQRREFMQIRSPIDGVVQQLQTHTVGGVVTAASELMVIAPLDDQLEVEAVIANQDIGFIQAGQEVILKVLAFPYMRYGYISGKVETVSLDAVLDDKANYNFVAKISMERDFLQIFQDKVPLKQGMLVSAEIKTERRSVMDYFLSPLRSAVDESLRER